jgi:hypothetical protein
MSVTQTLSGASTSNCRSSVFDATAAGYLYIGAMLGAVLRVVSKDFMQRYEILRCETPPSGASVRTVSR